MKKLIAVALCLILALSLTACQSSKEQQQQQKNDVVNPMTEYESLEALNEAFGCNMRHPAVMGVTDESYYAIAGEETDVAQYGFSVNGQEYTLRFSSAFTEDISGIYVGGKSILEDIDGEAVIAGGGYRVARWMDVNGQYVLATDDSIDAGVFADIADEIKDLTAPGMSDAEKAAYYEELAGSWTDTFSERATADIEAADDAVKITVNWGDSATETTVWTMTAKLSEDGLLCYDDCKKVELTLEDNASEEVVYEDGAGYFSLGTDGLLYWDGAAEADCVDCAFQKDA